jgi:hypothetical protein
MHIDSYHYIYGKLLSYLEKLFLEQFWVFRIIEDKYWVLMYTTLISFIINILV